MLELRTLDLSLAGMLLVLALGAGSLLCGLLPVGREKPGVLQLAAGAGVGLDLFFALLLLWDVLTVPLGYAWAVSCAVLAVLALLAAVWFGKLTIFPEEGGAAAPHDRVQRGQLRRCVLALLAAYAMMAVWLVFLMVHSGDHRMGERYFTLSFSLCVLSGILLGSGMSVHTVYSRIEALVDRQYQAELLNMMQIVRSQRHDFNFHMQAVSSLIKSGSYSQCESYIDTMVKSVAALNDVLPLRDPAVSALVNTFREMAASRDIRLEVQILDRLEDLPCTVYELNTVLGNLLQNAVDEVVTAPKDKRWIRLLTVQRGRWHVIKVSNPCDRDIREFREVFRAGYSTKQSHEGIGLATVKKITGRYGGGVTLEHREGVVHFIANIPLHRD